MFGADRAKVLGLLLGEAEGSALCARTRDGETIGYVLTRLGRAATYVGPLAATHSAVAERLLDGALSRFEGREICLDVHVGGLLSTAALEDRGLEKRRALTRMSDGLRSPAGTGRSVCASGGPELG
jgi:hypothetical protein